jgi:8-oxo-dGTP diphosphatase
MPTSSTEPSDAVASYTPILATLGYVLSPDGQSVLMIHRNARPADAHYGKYNGLGGKLHPDEDIAAGLAREIREEAGLEIEVLTLRGTVSWPGFGKGGEDWFGFVFRIDRWRGTPVTANPEGALEWVPLARLHELNLWEGDRCWLDMVFDADPRPFHGVCPYRDGQPVSWAYSR